MPLRRPAADIRDSSEGDDILKALNNTIAAGKLALRVPNNEDGARKNATWDLELNNYIAVWGSSTKLSFN